MTDGEKLRPAKHVLNRPDDWVDRPKEIDNLPTRVKYLTAMAKSLGGDGSLIQSIIEDVRNFKYDISPPGDLDSKRRETDPGYNQQVELIQKLGNWLLEGSPRNHLSYTVGTLALHLIHDPVSNFNDVNLRQTIDAWTDGSCGAEFERLLKEGK